jgi:hypothetical protein
MSFSIVFNSLYPYEEVIAGNNADLIYQYDFTNMEQGIYEVSFSYRGKQNVLNSTDLCLVYVDFGAFRSVFEAKGQDTQNRYTQFIGFLHNQYDSNTDSYLYANLNDNPPFELKFKPSGNTIRVCLKNPDGTLFTTHGAQNPAEYIMTLHFKKIN